MGWGGGEGGRRGEKGREKGRRDVLPSRGFSTDSDPSLDPPPPIMQPQDITVYMFWRFFEEAIMSFRS